MDYLDYCSLQAKVLLIMRLLDHVHGISRRDRYAKVVIVNSFIDYPAVCCVLCLCFRIEDKCEKGGSLTNWTAEMTNQVLQHHSMLSDFREYLTGYILSYAY